MQIDMSPQAITLRLKQASQLRRLCLSLGKSERQNTQLLPFAGEVTSASAEALTIPTPAVTAPPTTSAPPLPLTAEQ